MYATMYIPSSIKQPVWFLFTLPPFYQMLYTISQPITTFVSYEVDAPEGLTKDQLMEFLADKNLNLQHDGFMKDEVKAMYAEFMNTAIVEADGRDIDV